MGATVTGAPVAGDSLTTQIAQPSPFADSARGFQTHTGSSVPYYNIDTPNTATVTAGDIRQTAQDSFVTAKSTTAAFTQGDGNGIVTKAFGVTTARTVIVSSDGSGNAVAVGGTLFSTDAAVCVMYQSDGTTVVAVGAAISDVRFVECTLGATQNIRITATDATLETAENYAGSTKNITYTITKTAGGYVVGSTVLALESDLALVLTAASTAVLNAASFVWSDVSAVSHSFITTDWTNGYLVKNLATDTQNLLK